MSGYMEEICAMVRGFGSSPTLSEMERRTLDAKGIAGPTSAHVVEEVHVPLNLAYMTFTTGSSAFQNPVGVTYEELPARLAASAEVFARVGLSAGMRVLVTYPPLVNVFGGGEAFRLSGLSVSFLLRSSRDAFLAALYESRPHAVVGESSFLRAALEDAKHLGVADELPRGAVLLTAGTPLDLALLPTAEEVLGASVHDLYGCQEFGWLALDGRPLRDDVTLVKVSSEGGGRYEFVAGGLPMGDQFPVAESGHAADRRGRIITYRRQRSYPEYETVVRETTLSSRVTLERAARSILRLKGRIVRAAPECRTGAPRTVLELVPAPGAKGASFTIEGPGKTRCFDDLVRAQIAYQQNGKADPVWKKRR